MLAIVEAKTHLLVVFESLCAIQESLSKWSLVAPPSVRRH